MKISGRYDVRGGRGIRPCQRRHRVL